MTLKLIPIGLFSLALAGSVDAQSVDISWLQQASVSCGGGLNLEVQGEFEAAVVKRLRLAAGEAEGSYRQSDVEKLLAQFAAEQKQPVYQDYIKCLLTLMQSASSIAGLPSREVELTSSVAVEPLEPVRRGQRFAMAAGDVVAIRDFSMIFTVHEVSDSASQNGRPYIYYTWSNSETGREAKNQYVYQGDLIKIEEDCHLVPYKINLEGRQVSLLTNC